MSGLPVEFDLTGSKLSLDLAEGQQVPNVVRVTMGEELVGDYVRIDNNGSLVREASKDYGVTNPKEARAKVPDIKVHGDPNLWYCVGKASSQSGGWMKSTKAMLVPGAGVVVQASTQQGDNVAEALTFVPSASLLREGKGRYSLVGLSKEVGIMLIEHNGCLKRIRPDELKELERVEASDD